MQFCYSQLGLSKKDLFSKQSANYDKKEVFNDYTVYIYTGEISKLDNQLCNEVISYFIDNDSEICFKESYTSCAQAANSYVKVFDQIGVLVEKNKWKNHSDNSIYTLLVQDKISYVEHFFDISELTENQIEIVEEPIKLNTSKFELISLAKDFFKNYIPIRLKELDEEGYASEYTDAREFYVGDINLDKNPDVVVLYTVEGVGKGNNWARHILMLVSDGKDITHLNHTLVYGTFEGEGKFLGIKNGYAIFELITYQSEDIREKLKEQGPTKYQKVGYGLRDGLIVMDEISD
tara:strand:+ start:140 stop:1012 length:873 start_codon:yes stop_codon:yes gene_type:complete